MALVPGSTEERVIAGVSVGRGNGRIKAAVLRCHGEGYGLKLARIDSLSVAAPTDPRASPIAEAVSSALRSLFERADVASNSLLAIGFLSSLIQESLVAAILADQLGATVVTGFSFRDLAAGGAGHPLGAVPDWLLYHSLRRRRLLVSLAATLEITFLNADPTPTDIVCLDAGPGCAFLDGFVSELSRGRYSYDPHGRFAVQGRASEELIHSWQSHPLLLRPPPRFLSGRDFSTELRGASLAFARDLRLSGPDLLCSAHHFIARCLRDVLQRFVPLTSVDEVLVRGGGVANGLLWKLIRGELSARPVRRVEELGIPAEARSALHAALLAYCAVEYLPSNVPALTGASRPVVLGHLVPGNDDNWDHFLCNLNDRFELRDRAA